MSARDASDTECCTVAVRMIRCLSSYGPDASLHREILICYGQIRIHDVLMDNHCSCVDWCPWLWVTSLTADLS